MEEWRAEVARRSTLAESNTVLLSAIPRKAPAAFSGAGAFRARSRAHGAMSRIRSTVLEAFGTADRAEELLSLGLFRAADLSMPVRALSTGGRRKLELARLVTSPVDLLLLDEPTNHLAPALVEELEAALAGCAGALVIVTHDRRTRGGFAGTRLEMAGGEVGEVCEAGVGA